MPPKPAKPANALLHGALDALILKTLTPGPSHGYAIARSIEEKTGDTVLVEDGSLYPALYRLTDAGREQLAVEMATWKAFAAGVSKVLFSS